MILGGNKSSVGIDIGTASIKIVELQRERRDILLKNYGEYKRIRNKKTFPFHTNSFSFQEEEVAEAIKGLLSETKIETRSASFSLPAFSSFFTVIDLPLMQPDEISGAVKYQSYKYIPLPLQEVVIDWEIIQDETVENDRVKVLLVAVPKDLVNKYQNLSKILNISINVLEVEIFSEVRTLVGDYKDPMVIVNIGDRASNVTVIDGGFIRISQSIEFSGFHLTKSISEALNISFLRAEEIKKEKGITPEVGSLASGPIFPIVDKIIFNMQKVINTYLSRNPQREIKRIILAGGGANMPGLVDYFYSKTNIKTERAQCFSGIKYPSPLESAIQEINSSFSVAVGLALYGLKENK
jgi:type IV pilus assembly protein PilM